MSRWFQLSSKIAAKAAIGLGLLLVCVPSTRATSITDYLARVNNTLSLIQQLQSAYEVESDSNPEHFVNSSLTLVRQQMPQHETVQLPGQSISVDNSWLSQALSDFEKSNDWNRRHDMLARIGERLRAIQERLHEMRNASTATTDKEGDKGRLAEILRRAEYIQKAPEASTSDKLLERFLRWFLGLFPRIKPMQPGGSRWLGTVAQIFIVGICIAAIALLIWRYGPRFMKGRRQKKAKREARIVLGERLEPDQTAADLLAQADALARSGDLRAAIRKAYIALLCELGDRKLISLAQHKTNRDYLYSVRDKMSLYSSMRKLTNSFELHWYGLVPAAESDWNDFRNDYQRIIKG